jgi:hypothetical protein
MVIEFEVGKTYRYKGKIGDPSPFTDIGIDEHDARLMVSGNPLVCTYVGEGPWRPMVGFRGMSHEDNGWAFTGLYDLFEEVEETTAAKDGRKEEKKETAKLEVGKTYRYTGSMHGGFFDFLRIGIDPEDVEYMASGKPLTVELYEFPRRVKFKEFDHPWAFTDAMLNKFEEVPASTDTYVPIKEFEEGKWYVCHAVNRPSSWNEDGKMDGLLDGKPHKCIMGCKHKAEFENMPLHGDGGWNFYSTMYYFEEVPAPTAEVDWKAKYTALKGKAIEMLRILGDVAEDFKEEIESL